MHSLVPLRHGIARTLLGAAATAALFACSSTDRTPITGLKAAPDAPRNATITNGSIGVCKNAGPAGTYHFHVDVIGGGAYVLTPGADFTITFDGVDPSCVSDIYKTVPPWAPGLTAIIKISEVLLPPGVAVDSINATDRFGTIETSVIGGGTIVISEEVLGIHNANFYNVALPSVTCTAITGVAGVAITPVQLVGTGGSGGYTFTQTGLPAGLSMSSSGLITGTPTASGTTSYQVTVTDNTGHTGTSGSCAVTVTPPDMVVTCAAITGAVKGVPITPAAVSASGGAGGPYTFASASLAAYGLSIDANTGVISGTPNQSGTLNYTVTVTDKDGNHSDKNCSVDVAPPVSGNCAVITGAIKGVPITPVAVTGSGGHGGPYTFSSASLAAYGLSIDANTGIISGTPNTSGTLNYTVTVTDNDGHSGDINCSVDVAPPVSGNCAVIIGAIKGVPITPVAVTGSGGHGGPYTFSSASLAAYGLSIDLNTGVISGTPNASGTLNYTVTVTDKDGHSGNINCSVDVSPLVSGNCAVIIGAIKGVPITPVAVTGSGGHGGPYTFSSASLAAYGLSIDSNTGIISGTPNTSGTLNYTVTVTDNDGHSGDINCSVDVAPPVSGNCAVIVGAIKGVPIAPVAVTGSGGHGGPYTFSSAGLAAYGLSINTTTGVISGTPNTSGTLNYTVTVTDKDGHSGDINCSVDVAPPVSGTCAVIIGAIKGVPISPVAVTGSGGHGGPYTFSSASLAAYGLSIDANTGIISGTPNASGTLNYTVTVTDKDGHSGTINCSVDVAPPLSGTCAVIVGAVKGVPINPVAVTGSGGHGGPYTFSSASLAAYGLTINATTGVISGTPNTSGTLNYTVTVTDKDGHSGTINCSVDVAPPLSGTCAVIIGAIKGVPISPVAVTGSGGHGGPYTFSSASLAAYGLTINATTGVISGTPNASGTLNYTVTVTDKDGHSGTINCSVDVAPPVSGNCVVILGAIQGVPITPVAVTGSGGHGGPYTFSSASLAAHGLTINATTGVISGTPNASGTLNYTVTVTDKDGHSGTINCSVTVTLKVGDYCTYTPGGWGAPPSGGNVAALMTSKWSLVYSSGVTIGTTGSATYHYAKWNTPAFITGYLPDGGTPGVFTINYVDKGTTSAKEFGSQVLALRLNIDFSNKGYIKPGLAAQKVVGGPLAGLTVTQVMALANAAIGGNTSVLTPYGITPAIFTNILGGINGNYDDCKVNNGVLNP